MQVRVDALLVMALVLGGCSRDFSSCPTGYENDHGVCRVICEEKSGCRSVASQSLVLGLGHGCIRRIDGSVGCWGRNDEGQLGTGAASEEDALVLEPVRGLDRVVSLSAKGKHTCALSIDGAVSCWGYNELGQLGAGAIGKRKASPISVEDGTFPLVATQVVARKNHTCARQQGGQIVCWGSNTNGQLGNSSTVASDYPVLVETLAESNHVTAGFQHSCAVDPAGHVWCWGRNDVGQMGNGEAGPEEEVWSPVKTRLFEVAQQPAVDLCAGDDFSCAVLQDGRVFCWGGGAYGRLGGGGTQDQSIPQEVAGLDQAVTDISCGDNHVCALLVDRTLWCWGNNADGRLGDGTAEHGFFPGPVLLGQEPLKEVATIVTSPNSSCAGRLDGTFWCWGDNRRGQLGLGFASEERTEILTPRPMTILGTCGDGACEIGESVSRCPQDCTQHPL